MFPTSHRRMSRHTNSYVLRLEAYYSLPISFLTFQLPLSTEVSLSHPNRACEFLSPVHNIGPNLLSIPQRITLKDNESLL